MAESLRRKLTTLMSADAAGYSRLMEHDEPGTLARLKDYRATMGGFVARHRGRVVNTAGDSLLAEFDSVVEAVLCAVEIQRELGSRNAALDAGEQMRFRIGINLGDVMVEGSDLFGEGVNIAARLQGLAEPGGLCISGTAYDQVHGKLSLSYDFMGPQTMKNIAEAVPVYRVRLEEMPADAGGGDAAAPPPPCPPVWPCAPLEAESWREDAVSAQRIYRLFILSLVFALFALIAGAAGDRDALRASFWHSPHGKIEGDAAFTEDSSFAGKIGGQATVAPGVTAKIAGDVEGDLVIGPQAVAEVAGKIEGDVINYGGVLRLRGKLEGTMRNLPAETYDGPPAAQTPTDSRLDPGNAPTAEDGARREGGWRAALAGYVAALLGLAFVVTLLAGVVLAFVNRGGEGEEGSWLDSHYRFQIRTFWIGTLATAAGVVSAVLGVGLIVLALLPFWLLIRCLRGLRFLQQGRPHPKPDSWLLG